MLLLILDTAVLGLIIAAINPDEPPGCLRTVACALLMSLTMYVIVLVLPGLLAVAGFVVAAIIGAFAISALYEVTASRGIIAASIFLAYKVLTWACLGLLSAAGSANAP